MAKAKERFLDELVNFLGDPMFQIPVRTFMDESCLTFDPEVGATDDHKKIHENYIQLVNQLLQAFCDDAGVSVEDVIKAFDAMCTQNKELKEYFEVLYDQVMASTDFNIFFGAMAKRNIIIQQQVLVMILAATGCMPASFSLDEQGSDKDKGNAEAVLCSTADDRQEEDLLRQVMQASEQEHKKQRDLEKQEKDQLQRTLELSKAEAKALQSERRQVEQCLGDMATWFTKEPPQSQDTALSTDKKLEKLTLEAPPPPPPILAPVPSSSRPKADSNRGPMKATHAPAPALAPVKAPVSGSDAANAWLHSAHEEAAKHSAVHAAVAKNLANLSAEEIKQRQQYLMSQRDKLMAMKKQKREDQLQDAVKKQPQRPASARAARNAMGGTPAQSEEVDRTMAMRRAIAEKIKQEVIRK